jgi:integrase
LYNISTTSHRARKDSIVSHRSPGEGCVVQRPDGRWQGSLQVEGKRKTVYGKTEREARTKLLQIQKQLGQSGSIPQPGRRTVSELIDYWLENTGGSLKPRTVVDYRYRCDRYIRPQIGSVKLSRLEPTHLQKLYANLQAKGLKRAANQVHRILHRALSLAVLWSWLPANPADRVLKPTYAAPRRAVWTSEELASFLQGTQSHWLQPLWVLAISTGCRLGELLNLRWQDIDAEARTAAIHSTVARIQREWLEGTPKTRAGERTLLLPPEALAALRRQRAQQAEWRLRTGSGWADLGLVFTGLSGQRLHAAVVSHALHRECVRLALPPVTPHGLRHLHASLLLANGIPITAVSARLGHANPSITGSIYAHAIKGQDEAAAEAIGRVLSRQHIEYNRSEDRWA